MLSRIEIERTNELAGGQRLLRLSIRFLANTNDGKHEADSQRGNDKSISQRISAQLDQLTRRSDADDRAQYGHEHQPGAGTPALLRRNHIGYQARIRTTPPIGGELHGKKAKQEEQNVATLAEERHQRQGKTICD